MMKENLRIGILTSGGDCQALNAAMRGVALALYEKNKKTQIIGIENGFEGLINGNCRNLSKDDFENILSIGGTILGSSRMPFKHINEPDENGTEKIPAMIKNYKKMGLDCLVVLGGNGSQKTANLLSMKGLNIVSLPKTIDNDVFETDMTFGYASALEVASKTIENIKTTAASHSRIFIVEIMGHKTGHLTLNAGIAGGADVILIPEIPFDTIAVAEKINQNETEGKNYSIIAIAEGAKTKQDALLSKKEYKAKMGNISISFHLASQLRMLCNKDIRISIPGHIQRGGSPSTQDKILASQLGSAAAQCILKGKFGIMVSITNDKIIPVELNKVAGFTKYVDVESDTIKLAKALGISFGD